jgi:hypothetical protein
MPLLTGAKHREVRGIGQVLFDERDGDIEGKARNRDACLRGEDPLSLARARLDAARRLGGHHGGRRVHPRVVARASRASLCVPRPRSEIRGKRGRRCSFSSKRLFVIFVSRVVSAACFRRPALGVATPVCRRESLLVMNRISS